MRLDVGEELTKRVHTEVRPRQNWLKLGGAALKIGADCFRTSRKSHENQRTISEHEPMQWLRAGKCSCRHRRQLLSEAYSSPQGPVGTCDGATEVQFAVLNQWFARLSPGASRPLQVTVETRMGDVPL